MLTSVHVAAPELGRTLELVAPVRTTALVALGLALELALDSAAPVLDAVLMY